MEDQQTLTQLINGVVAEMRNVNYAETTIADFVRHATQFKDYVLKKTSIDYYTEEIGAAYLKEMIDYPFSEFRPLHYKEAAYVRCVNKIGEYRIHGTSIKTSKRKFESIENWGLEDIAIIESYLETMQTADNSDATKILRMNHIRKLYQFLSSRNLHSVASISEELIHDYICFLQGYSQVYLKHILGTLRKYFRYLYAVDYIKNDWSFSVPRVSAAKNSNIPELWDKEKVDKVLQSIDRGNPTGKRNYAIIMLVAELGLRTSDISSLKLCNLKWEKYEIDYVQHKTKRRTIQPLSKETGWAIIDYLQHGRKDVDEPYVFLTTNAPYRQISPNAVGNILKQARSKAGLQKQDGVVSGMHSLRHALARRLLEKGTELNVVADIMGHSSYSSTSPYLKVDIEGLRLCALSLENTEEV